MSTLRLNATESMYARKRTISDPQYGTTINYYALTGSLQYGGIYTSQGTWSCYDDYVAVAWISGYDTALLDQYSVTSFILRFKAQSIAPAGTVITLPLTPITSATTAQTIYNSVKGGTILYTLPNAVGVDGEITITITDKTLMKAVLNNGIGIYKVAYTDYYLYNNSDGDNAPYAEFVYTDANAPPIVNVTYPVSVTIIASNSNIFTWDYSQEASQAQSHYDLQYSADGGSTWTTFANKVASSAHQCTIPANTLSSGVYSWRVRAWTLSGTVVGDWSTTSIIAQINPVTSGVTCDNKPKPKVSWTSTEQQAFQIKLGDYDTGTIYSAAAFYTLPLYFDNNAYFLTMRTQNNLGVWSAWTTGFYTQITNTPGSAITLSTWQNGYAVSLGWATSGTYTKYYVYRNNVPIAKVTGTVYTDNLAAGENVYQIRGILATGYYTMSNALPQILDLPFDMISLVDIIAWKYLKYSANNPVSRNYNISEDITYLRFAGRKYPVSCSDGQMSYKGSFSYSFKTISEVEALRTLIGETVILKDRRGNRIIGVMNEAPYNVGSIFDFSFTITATDYNEMVTYD
jgi:hypothetical protein